MEGGGPVLLSSLLRGHLSLGWGDQRGGENIHRVQDRGQAARGEDRPQSRGSCPSWSVGVPC